jgi:hypothetical protein
MRTKKSPLIPGAAALLALGLSACLGLNSEGGKSKSSPSSAAVRLVPVSQPTDAAALARRGAGNAPADLESFQVAVSSITLVQSVQLGGETGTGWQSPQGTFTVFDNAALNNRMNTAAHHGADAALDADFIDFMQPSDLAKLATSAPFRSEQVADYNYVLVNWAPAFKVRASIPLGEGETVYTKTGTWDSSTYQTTASTPMMSGPAETVRVVSPNGGSFFRFLKPLSIKESDLNGTVMVHDTVSRHDSSGHVVPFDTVVAMGQLSVMLVFNSDELLSAWDSSSALAASGGPERAELTSPDGLGNIHVPVLDLTAVPYRQGQDIWRETYIFDAVDPQVPGRNVRVRLELYLVDDNIVAVGLRGISAGAGGPPVMAPSAFFVEEGADGSIDIQNWDHTSIFSPFHRLDSIGPTGTATMDFMYLTIPGATYSLVEKRKMN